MTDDLRQLHVVVHGRVQGVYFRQATTRVARDLGVRGWVKNRHDGTVEVMAVGTSAQLTRLLAFLREGPPAAHVTGMETEYLIPVESFSGFHVRY